MTKSHTRQQLSTLIKQITKDMPYGVEITETKTGILVHFAIFDEGPPLIDRDTPKVILL